MSKTITSREHSRLTKEINTDYAKWFDTQRAKGNKEILQYDKDLAEYKKLDNALWREKQEKEHKYAQKYQKQWLERYKPAYTNKTDDEIIATQGKQAGKSYDEVKETLRFARRQMELRLNLYPLAEFYQDGKGAIAKLIAEANAAKQAGQDFSGQVAGAFSKEIDGAEASIDLVWGKITNAQTHEGYGLAHIIDKHPEITPQMLDEIIAQGKVESKNGVYTITLQKDGKDYRVGLSKGWNGKGDNEWIITAYQNNKGSAETSYHDTFTTKEPLENLDNEIIQKISQKFNKDEKFAKNLYEWHKDSHPITKEADGTPKVFYHGAKVAKGKDIEIFDTNFSNGNYEHSQLKNLPFGFFFSSDLRTAKGYTYSDNKLVKKVFLKAKNPLVIDFEGKTYNQGINDAISKMSQEFKQDTHDAIIYKNIIDDSEQDTTKKNKIANTFIVFDSNQIKAVGNKGTFDATNPNIYHTSSTAGGGVLGGTIAGVERDEEGNIIGFSPEKFALGFASGASAAKALSKIAHTKPVQNLTNSKAITLSQKSIQKLATNPRAKAILEKIQAKSSTNNDKMPSQKLATISPEKTQKGQNQMEIKQNTNGDYLLKDSEGKSHIVRKDLAQQWLDTFGLKSLSDDFVPNFTPQIKEILTQNGVDKIHLKIGSLLKLEANHRTKYLDRIKPTLETPEAVLKQNDGALIFVKDFKEKKFFTSVARDKNGEWIITSNAPKSINNIRNKIKQGGEILYNEIKEV